MISKPKKSPGKSKEKISLPAISPPPSPFKVESEKVIKRPPPIELVIDTPVMQHEIRQLTDDEFKKWQDLKKAEKEIQNT